MCGIVGFANLGQHPDTYPARIERMLRSIEYRGPDEQGYYWDSKVALGNARLAIIDIKSGNQPMGTADGRYWIVFNGEIFNYLELRRELEAEHVEFSTQSDTEVLLLALVHWGKDALDRLNGQFAFAFYDRRTSEIIFARDRFGERPLHYWMQDKRFVFGSEIKALLSLPEISATLDPEGVRQACRHWTTLPDQTCFAGIKSLPPGHFGVLGKNGFDIAPYWRLPEKTENLCDPEEAAIQVRKGMERAVSLRQRSDVDVAVYISGGLDSSIVAGLATRLAGRKLNSYSVTFDETDFDESGYQQSVADVIGSDHTNVNVTQADIRACFPNVIRHAETVQFRTAAAPLYLLAQKVNADGIKVALTGEGADEIFLGYDIFKEARFLTTFEDMRDDTQRLETLGKLYPYLAHFGTTQAKSLLQFYKPFTGADDGTRPLVSHSPRFANGAFAARLVRAGSEPVPEAEILLEKVQAIYPDFNKKDVVERTQILELLTLLNGYLLSSQGDRMMSAHSLEGRTPFLDVEIARLAASLPQDLLLKGGFDEKHILKVAFADIVPDAVRHRPKQPYRAPGSSCFRRTDGDDWVSEVLTPERIARSAVLEADFANALIAQVERTPPHRISPRLDQAYMALVSTLLLEDQIDSGAFLIDRSIDPVLRIDGRLLGSA